MIELLVVVAIIGILAAVGIVAYSGYTASAKLKACEGNHNQITKFVGLSLMECGDLGKQNLDLVNTDGNLDPVSCNNTNDTLAREFMSHFESKKFRSAFELILITNGLNSHYNFFFTVKNIISVKLSSVES